MKESRIGTSGWSYPHWEGVFYPPHLPQNKWLSYYSQFFDTVEVNSSFYHPLVPLLFPNGEIPLSEFIFPLKPAATLPI